MSSPVATPSRLTSLDQFRGYTVAGMCLVNFLAPFASVHAVLKHNDTYFSYADTIMPGFLFVVGFAFRMTYLKRRRQVDVFPTAWSYIRRSGKLLLLSLLIYCFVGDIPRWFLIREMPAEFGRSGEAKETKPEEVVASGQRGMRSVTTVFNSPLTASDSPLISDATERLRAWRALSWQRRLLVHWRINAARLLKSELWETLAIIGATQLVILPWIGCRFWIRFVVMALLGAAHCLMSYWFNWDFLYGVHGNWMSKAWMTRDDRGWDGGIFGPINWGIVMLGGTLAYDLVTETASRVSAITRLMLWGSAFMAVGYSMSCLTRLYDLAGPQLAEMRARQMRQDADKSSLDDARTEARTTLKKVRVPGDPNRSSPETEAETERLEGTLVAIEDARHSFPDLQLAKSPVLPPWEKLRGRSLSGLLAEPPFIAPPADDPHRDPPPWIEHRLRNYWMLGKRMPNLSFILFATGFEFTVFGLFVAACDVGGWRFGLFRTLGTNPLAAYFIHGGIALVLSLVVPHDAPLVFCLTGFAIAFGITYLLVRFLEKRGVYWRM